MKRFGVTILAAVLILSLCACAKEESNALAGTWQSQWSMGEDMNLSVNFVVHEDSTFALTVDAGDLLRKIDKVTSQLEAAGQDVSAGLEQVLGAAGLDSEKLQSILDLLFPKKDGETERKTTATIEGRCKAEDGKLYISLIKAVGLYGDTHLLYSVEGDALTLSMPEEASEITKMLGGLLPITLQKVQ